MWVGPLFGAAVAALVYRPFSHRLEHLKVAQDEKPYQPRTATDGSAGSTVSTYCQGSSASVDSMA
ncbi:unnamed protein product [Polarella glacialis]|uniref:Uncharacterized protein n=1 Tax=Polarella glacialis TaxID=89957 RepID=A0A813DUR2_POLGL|nr:unnamed protein product [Polarella glacialis]